MRALPLCSVNGTFFRAVDRDYADAALSGSHLAGRYSRRTQPTLYLSGSRTGVEAAMIAHRADKRREKVVFSFAVTADHIADLREPTILARLREEAGDPFADWQSIAGHGGIPSSWRVRDLVEQQGAQGLIDPSRKAPGLWHLVLFRWNLPGVPVVRPLAR